MGLELVENEQEGEGHWDETASEILLFFLKNRNQALYAVHVDNVVVVVDHQPQYMTEVR